jgi:hypothetical protein
MIIIKEKEDKLNEGSMVPSSKRELIDDIKTYGNSSLFTLNDGNGKNHLFLNYRCLKVDDHYALFIDRETGLISGFPFPSFGGITKFKKEETMGNIAVYSFPLGSRKNQVFFFIGK